jgi:hypothetical protein
MKKLGRKSFVPLGWNITQRILERAPLLRRAQHSLATGSSSDTRLEHRIRRKLVEIE